MIYDKAKFRESGGGLLIKELRELPESSQRNRLILTLESQDWDFPVLFDTEAGNVLVRDITAPREAPLTYLLWIDSDVLEINLDTYSGPRRMARVLIGNRRLPVALSTATKDLIARYFSVYGTSGSGAIGSDGVIHDRLFGVIPEFEEDQP